MSDQPVLSVVTPVFNTPAEYLTALADCLPAAIRGNPYEWILVDDHSNDAQTRAALETLAQQSVVRSISNAAAKGAAGARNTGARNASGKYLLFVDADDLLQPGGIALLLQAVQTNPAVRCVVAEFEQFDGAPSENDIDPNLLDDAACAIRHQPDIARRLIFETLFNQGSYLVERELFFELGGFDERFRIGEDWLLWMRLAVRQEIYHCRRLVMWQRRGHASVMSGELVTTEAVVAPYLAARQEPDFAGLKKPLRWRICKLYRVLAERNLDAGDRGRAIRFAGKAALWSINDPAQWRNLLRVIVGRRRH